MSKFREIWPTKNRWNRVLVTWQKKQQKISPGSTAVATVRIASKICRGHPPTVYSEGSRFHLNRFTFGGVIAEHVTTAKTRRIVNPVFGWSLASSRITMRSLADWLWQLKLQSVFCSSVMYDVLFSAVWNLEIFHIAKLNLQSYSRSGAVG